MKKVLIIGFLFGVFLLPFTMAMVMSITRLNLINPVIIPSLYVEKPFYKEFPMTNRVGEDDGNGGVKWTMVESKGIGASVFGRVIGKTVDGIYYALIFWIIYFLVRKLRNKNRTQSS